MRDDATVFLVDDDASVRDALKWLIESIDIKVQMHDSAANFLDEFEPDRAGCLVLDVRMPGTSGLELQDQLVRKKIELPIIFITGHADVPMSIRALEGGAFAFVEKPINHQQLLDHIQRAIAHNLNMRRSRLSGPRLLSRIKTLTPREHEVMDLIAAGKTMKQIAAQLEIGIQTCSKHRARVLEKMGAENDVELVRLLLTADQNA
jgi:FixJ family two-component response regulator